MAARGFFFAPRRGLSARLYPMSIVDRWSDRPRQPALATGDRATMIAGGVLDDANNGADGCPLSGGNTHH
jgi:hypothetical protein